MEKGKKTNVVIKVDSEIWKMFMALSVMRGIDRGELFEESMKETIKKSGLK